RFSVLIIFILFRSQNRGGSVCAREASKSASPRASSHFVAARSCGGPRAACWVYHEVCAFFLAKFYFLCGLCIQRNCSILAPEMRKELGARAPISEKTGPWPIFPSLGRARVSNFASDDFDK